MSGRNKTERILQELKVAKESMDVISNYFIMLPETINKIFMLSFYEPWINFYKVMIKIGKNTKLIKTILPTKEY